jgi:steroid delta-isomerase-like uncharacterized protein
MIVGIGAWVLAGSHSLHIVARRWFFSMMLLAHVGLAACHSTQQDTGDADSSGNIDKILTIFDAINAPSHSDDGFRAVVVDVAATDFVRHDLTGNIRGIHGQDGAVNFLSELRDGFSDLQLEIQDIFESDDKVVVVFVAAGTHDGPFLGHGPTNRRINVSNINIYRFEEGRVRETWQLYDALSLLRQLGITSP